MQNCSHMHTYCWGHVPKPPSMSMFAMLGDDAKCALYPIICCTVYEAPCIHCVQG